MFYRQKLDTIIRIYDRIGYITNRNNFAERIVSQSGAIFLSVLNRSPQSLDGLAHKIAAHFVGADLETIRRDIKEFYAMLEQDGFITSGETAQECDKNDMRFSYRSLETKYRNDDYSPVIMRVKKSTRDFLNEYFKDKPKLMSLQIELTSKCNERCVHCYIPHESKVTSMEPQLFYAVLKQCWEMGVWNLTLSGGEPMLHKNFCEFLRKCKEYDFAVDVLSNLTLLDDEIVGELKANCLSSVQVSLYSMNPDIHDTITQAKGSWEKTMKAILKLVENDIPLQISCPVMKQNQDCHVAVMNWANEIKARVISDYMMIAKYDRSTQNLANRLSLDEVAKVIYGIVENNPKYRNLMLNADVLEEEKRDISNDIICGVCISGICMVANGDVYPCPGWQSYIVGNVRNIPLQEIWERSERVRYLRGIRKKDFPKCLACEDRAFCDMCMVRNANENSDGDPFKINTHFCNVAKLNRRIVMDWREKLQCAEFAHSQPHITLSQ